ncbi:MAG TPA: hypothetical protein VNF71_12475, partial [Acidimicrobiales bacterium]|nr:hypothetical protein [Acidimicrobiales bacterium]
MSEEVCDQAAWRLGSIVSDRAFPLRGGLPVSADQIRERRGQRGRRRRIPERVEAARRGPRSCRGHEAGTLVGVDAEHICEPLGHCPRRSPLPGLDLADGDRRAA